MIDFFFNIKFGQTALQIGASTNNRALVNMLLQHSKVGVNIQDKVFLFMLLYAS